VRLELASAIRRLGNIATAHLMLNSQSPGEQLTSFRAYLTLICTETHASLGGERIALIVDSDELALETSRAINLALIASEALTNAMKYAFPDGRQGTIRVDCHANGQTAALTIIDDGIGFADTSREGALGLRLIRTLAKAIGGDAEIDGTNGARIGVRFSI
jgi:two-component sensor histidine kinase